MPKPLLTPVHAASCGPYLVPKPQLTHLTSASCGPHLVPKPHLTPHRCLLQVDGATVVTTLTISVVWIIYSMIPPYLLIHYTWIGRGTTLQFMCRVAFVLSFVTSICAMLLLWAVYPKDYDFGSATKVRLSSASVFESFVCMLLLWAVYLKDYDFGSATKVPLLIPNRLF